MAFSPCLRKSRNNAQMTSSLSALREPRVRPAGFEVRRRPAPALAARLRAPQRRDGGEGTLRRRKESFWPWIPIRLRRFRRAEPLWPAAETEVHHARRGGTHGCPSTRSWRGGAAAERRCRAPPGRAGPLAAKSRRDPQVHARWPQYAVVRE